MFISNLKQLIFNFIRMAIKPNAMLELHLPENRQCDIVRLLSVCKDVLSKAVERFEDLGQEGDRPGRGRQRPFNHSKDWPIIKERVQWYLRISMTKLAHETGISDRPVRQRAKQELGRRPYNIQKVQVLTSENRCVSIQRCRQLIRRAAGQRWERLFLTDEERFTAKQPQNWQNVRRCCAEDFSTWPSSNTAKIGCPSWNGAWIPRAARHP